MATEQSKGFDMQFQVGDEVIINLGKYGPRPAVVVAGVAPRFITDRVYPETIVVRHPTNGAVRYVRVDEVVR